MNKWSKNWKASRSKKKQRKYRENAPLHIRHKLISAHLSKELAKKLKTRSLPIRKGDKVKILIGQFKKKISIVTKVDLKRLRCFAEGAELVKKDGTKSPYPLHPSNLMILELHEDKKRMKA